MIPDGLQYSVGHFWNFQKNEQMPTRAPYSLQKDFKQYKKKYGNILYTYYYCKYGNLHF